MNNSKFLRFHNVGARACPALAAGLLVALVFAAPAAADRKTVNAGAAIVAQLDGVPRDKSNRFRRYKYLFGSLVSKCTESGADIIEVLGETVSTMRERGYDVTYGKMMGELSASIPAEFAGSVSCRETSDIVLSLFPQLR